MVKENERTLEELNECLTENELDLSDFNGVCFKDQTAAVVELLIKNNPESKFFEHFLSENYVKSSGEIWSDLSSIDDLSIENDLIHDRILDDSSLTSSSCEYVANWNRFETTINTRTFHGLQDEFDKGQTSHTNLRFNMYTADGQNYEDFLEKVFPPFQASGDKYITVTVLIPATHKQPSGIVSESDPSWIFHHAEYGSKKSLALRLFTVLNCLGIVTNSKNGIWSRLVSRLWLPVTFSKNVRNAEKVKRGSKYATLFEQIAQNGNALYPLFKGKKSSTVKFKDRSYAPENPSVATSGKSETKAPRNRHQLITGFNELMMFTSGTAISIKVPVNTNEEKTPHQPSIIIAPKKWVKALSNSLNTHVLEYNNLYYGKEIDPVRSYLFNEEYAYDSEWRRVHSERKYFAPSEDKNKGF